MCRVAVILQVLAALGSMAASMRYMTTAEFMPYHAAVVGQSWASLSPGLQVIILGMLRIVAGGFLACGLALAALAFPVHRGERWAPWASLLVGAAVWGPTLAVTLMLRSAQPTAQPPIIPSAVLLALVVIAFAAGSFGASGSARATDAGRTSKPR